MKTRHLFCAAASALALCTAVPALAHPAAPAAAQQASSVTVPPLGYTHRRLDNGMDVYTRNDPTSANVAVQVWYRVGGKDDPSGRSGFAHLFEHLMFKATENVPNETFDRLTEDVGGYNNAFTAEDVTAYHEMVPANHLERILFAEADRMGTLVVDADNFASERDVVKEEYRQSVLSNPYGRLFSLFMPATFFKEHPYRRGVIGSIEELESASLEDVLRFHRTYYRPDNAFLIVDGNFNEAQLNGWVDQYFGPLKNPDTAIPVRQVREPAIEAPEEHTFYAPNVPLETVVIGWHTVPASHPDVAALSVLDGILSTGESSRLHRALVYEAQAANNASSMPDFMKEAGYLMAYAMMSQGRTLDEGRSLLEREIARLRDEPVTEAELTEAKNELIAAALAEREGAQGRADVLGWALIKTGDAASADNEVAELQKVTAADIQRVARQYLTPQRQITIRYLASDEANPTTQQRVNMEGPVKVADLAPMGTPSVTKPEAERTPIPQAGPEVSPATPAIADFRLDNGVRVLVAPNTQLPLVSARLTFKAGSAYDPQGKAGVAAMTANMLTQGTQTLSAPQIATQIEQLGANIGAGAGRDQFNVYASSPSNVFGQTMELLSQIVLKPAFSQEELERQRTQALDNLRVALSQPGSLASMATTRLNFADSPYGRLSTEATVSSLTPDDLKAFHTTYIRPDQAILTFSGDITPERARELAQSAFGNWRATTPPSAAAPHIPANSQPPRVVVINLPGAGQAAVSVSSQSIARTDEAYFPLALGNTLLGGSYSSRLNQEIRINRGLSYGARSGVGAMAQSGLFTASTQTKNETADEVVELLLEELGKMSQSPASEAELGPRRAIMIGGFGRSIESVSGLGSLVAELAAYDLPLSELAVYADRVKAVTPQDIQAAFAARIPADRANVVVVGDASMFLDDLRAKYPNVEVIDAKDLNLDSANLR
ncbi:pitrilysin family protein [uncultured Brevundimonas sp.]|uniref:M16 family metallopeptidase n=1 Tax=uncultured Brevundimonas sp. TaxID=213418 RepID=UPI00262B9FF0|nr:pitrilysin family protein [uncultured Brevundimonas sp.]